MQHIIMKNILKALALCLMLSIVATGAFAVHLTHVNASLTITFGEPADRQVAIAEAVDMSQLHPLPLRKPAH